MEEAKQIILEAYGLDKIENNPRKLGPMDAKKLFVKYCREILEMSYTDIGKQLNHRHCNIIALYRKSDWVATKDPKGKRVWHLMTNKRRCNETLEKMTQLMEGIEDIEIYESVLKALPSIINAKKNFNL